MSGFSTARLFGGAITVSLPLAYADVSEIRQVPDNQEVYLDRDGFTSIIFDLTERVTDVSSDEAALLYHLSDVTDEDEDGGGAAKIWSSSAATCSKLPPGTPAYTLLATTVAATSASSTPTPSAVTGILLTLVRLESQATDVVVTINVPNVPGNTDDVDIGAGRLGPLLEEALLMRNRVLETLDIRDWDLFG
ncbi:MAG: hypothetical protein M1838_000406 [Thelocarpon superellum]|nr:MAG: hypothetical protein M1838_000406 [Thelocarpon superellum]